MIEKIQNLCMFQPTKNWPKSWLEILTHLNGCSEIPASGGSLTSSFFWSSHCNPFPRVFCRENQLNKMSLFSLFFSTEDNNFLNPFFYIYSMTYVTYFQPKKKHTFLYFRKTKRHHHTFFLVTIFFYGKFFHFWYTILKAIKSDHYLLKCLF